MTVRTGIRVLTAALLLPLLAGYASAVRGAPGATSSSLAVLSRDGRLLVAVPDLGALAIVDTTSHSRVGQVLVGREPASVAISPNGLFAYVANRGSNSITVVDLQGVRALGEVPVGRQPTAVLTSPDGKRIYVANWASQDVTVLDASSFETLATLPLPGDPYTLALSSGGEWLYVGQLRAGLISRISTDALAVQDSLSLGRGAYLLTAIVPAADGRQAYVLHSQAAARGRATVPGAVEPRFSIVDLQAFELLEPSLPLAAGEHRPDFPLAGAFGPGEQVLWIAASGTNELLALDLARHQVVARVETGYNPRAVVLGPDGRFLYVVNALDPNVTVVDGAERQVVLTIPTGVLPLTPEVLEGKRRYYSAPLSGTGAEVSCATCHLTGEGDGRVWRFGRTALNTPVLWSVKDTSPWGWRQSWLEVGQAAAHAQGLPSDPGLATAGAQAAADPTLISFLQTLNGPPDSAGRKGGLSLVQERGRAIFQSAGCTTCHSGVAYSDGQRHDVGTGGAFDTPILLGLANSAPYLHDGRAATLQEAIGAHAAASWSEGQRSDLVAFLQGLPYGERADGRSGPGGGLRAILDQILKLLGR